MNPVQILLAEWNAEAASTRKMLERLPADKLAWKPHAKSMSLGSLAIHLGQASSYFGHGILEQDVCGWQAPPAVEMTKENILAAWDEGAAVVRAGFEALAPETLEVTWTFGSLEKPFMQLPRAAALRAFLFSHLIHHRGQLSVYLRLLDVSVPGMYGPSADEKP